MSKKRIVVIAVLLGLVVIGGVGAVGFWKYHEQPQFCATCHIMDPTIEQQVNELVVYVRGDYEIPL